MIEPGEEEEIFASRQARIETQVAAGVESEIAADCARVASDIVAGNPCAAPGGKQQCRKDTEERGLACTVHAEQSNGLSLRGFQGNTGERRHGESLKGLEQNAPAAARRGE